MRIAGMQYANGRLTTRILFPCFYSRFLIYQLYRIAKTTYVYIRKEPRNIIPRLFLYAQM